MFVCCERCVLSGKGLCDELITRPEEYYRLWCVVVCDLETSRMRRQWPALGCSATEKIKNLNLYSEFPLYTSLLHAKKHHADLPRCWYLSTTTYGVTKQRWRCD
jgi:hypothetical protein